MLDPGAASEATIERRLDRDRELVLARGRFGDLFACYERHVATWGLALDPLGLVMMRQGLAGVALHLSSRPRDESTAFTFNFAKPATNVFVSGRSADETVTGRIFTENVATAEESRLFVQTSRSGGRDFTSVIDVTGLDLLLVLEDYCARSEQAPARFFELEGDEFLMAASLPVENRDFLAAMTVAEAREAYDRGRLLDHKRFRFHCGCDPMRMREAMRTMFRNRLDEIFAGDPSVAVSCPRCGRRWTLRRDQIEEENGS